MVDANRAFVRTKVEKLKAIKVKTCNERKPLVQTSLATAREFGENNHRVATVDDMLMGGSSLKPDD